MTLDTNTLLIAILALLIIIVLWIIKVEVRIGKLLKGKGSKTLEDSILEINKELRLLQDFEQKTKKYLAIADKKLKRSIQAVKVMRFNPFKGTGAGGNQSFASTFVNEKGDGVVISSLYSRDRVSVFAKKLSEFNSDFELSEEEKHVVKEAEDSLKN